LERRAAHTAEELNLMKRKERKALRAARRKAMRAAAVSILK
jgi:hypothetical protein